MHFFSQYRGLRRENYVLFFGRIVTNLGSMVWPMLTMILNQKLGMSAGNIAILTAVFGVLMMPANLLGGKLADRLNKKNIIIVGDIVSVKVLACDAKKKRISLTMKGIPTENKAHETASSI